jgi:HPt (histidine-containing phosphotransfer) domain-containing protein
MTGGPQPRSDHPEAQVIDLAAGTERVMGDRAMFERVLARFRGEYSGATASIRAALSAGDTWLAGRLAHTLKGAAGMIEARALQRQALALEQALRGHSDDSALLLKRLDAELDRVLLEVDQVLGAAKARGPQRKPSIPASEALGRLRDLLDAGDGEALDVLANARGGLVEILGETRFGELESAINAFDFERALALLAQSSGSRVQRPG